jgi:hypothetical protein
MSLPSSLLRSEPNKKSALLATCFTLVSCLSFSLTLNVEVTCFSKILVDFQQTTQRYIPGDRTLQTSIFFFCLFFVLYCNNAVWKYTFFTINSWWKLLIILCHSMKSFDHIRSLNFIAILTKKKSVKGTGSFPNMMECILKYDFNMGYHKCNYILFFCKIVFTYYTNSSVYVFISPYDGDLVQYKIMSFLGGGVPESGIVKNY